MLTNIYDVLRAPKTAMARIADEADIYKSLNVQGISIFINGLVNEYDPMSEDPLWLTILSAVIATPVALVVIYLMAGVTRGIAHLLGGQGTWKKDFITLGYGMLPQLLFIPFEVLFLAIGIETGVIIAGIIATVWSLVLSVLGVSKAEKLSIIKSCIVLFAPTVIAFVLGMIFVFAVIGMPQ